MKQYPNNGPSRRIQALRLNPCRTQAETQEIRDWVKNYAQKGGRPETVAAYTV